MHIFKYVEIYFKTLSDPPAVINSLCYVESQIQVLERYQYFGSVPEVSRMLLRAAQIGID